MIAIELHDGTEGGARKIAEQLKDLGVLCKETHTTTLRFAPPLVIKKEEVDWAFQRIEQAFADRIGAEVYSADAPGAVKLVKQLVA